jgi:hypothetical protein
MPRSLFRLDLPLVLLLAWVVRPPASRVFPLASVGMFPASRVLPLDSVGIFPALLLVLLRPAAVVFLAPVLAAQAVARRAMAMATLDDMATAIGDVMASP